MSQLNIQTVVDGDCVWDGESDSWIDITQLDYKDLIEFRDDCGYDSIQYKYINVYIFKNYEFY